MGKSKINGYMDLSYALLKKAIKMIEAKKDVCKRPNHIRIEFWGGKVRIDQLVCYDIPLGRSTGITGGMCENCTRDSFGEYHDIPREGWDDDDKQEKEPL